MAPDAHPTDPWSSIEPIGQRDDRADAPTHPAADQSDQVEPDRRPPQFQLSPREQRMRGPGGDHSHERTPARTSTSQPPRKPKLRANLTVVEARSMAATLARQAYRDATQLDVVLQSDGTTKKVPALRPADRKHAAVRFGVAVDKWTMLDAKRGEAPATRGEREGLRALARRLLDEEMSDAAARGDEDASVEASGGTLREMTK